MSMDSNRNHRGTHRSHASNLMDLPLSTSNFQSGQSQNLSSLLPSSSLSRSSNLQQQAPAPPSSDPQSYLANTTATPHMIGTSTAFYDDALHGPAVVMNHETEQDHEMYLASFQPQPQPSYGYPLAYPDPHTQASTQAHAQHSHSQPPPQYLPTPSVSPTSTSPPMISPPSRSGHPQADIKQSGQYYPMSGTINMGAGAHREPPAISRTQSSKKSKGASANHSSSTAAISNVASTGSNTAKSSPSSSRKRARKSIDKPPSPTQPSNRALGGQNESQALLQLQDDSDDDDQEERSQPTQRLPGACRYCKKLKMKCDFASPDAASCKRCLQGGHQCVVEGRKQRIGPNKREFLLSQLRQKETIIESLLRQINNPAHRTPLTLLVPNLSNVAGGSSSSINGQTAGTPQAASSKSIQSWIAGTSVKNAGGRGGVAAFALDKRADGTGVDLLDEEEVDESNAARQRLDDDADVDEGDEDEDVDGVDATGTGKKVKLHYLPEEAAPLGLIADLSLENHTPKKKEKDKDKEGSVGPKEEGPGSQHHSESRVQPVASSNVVVVGDAATGPDASNINVPSALGTASGVATVDGAANAQAVNAYAAATANNNNAGEEENENNVGVANKSYFHPGPATDLGLRRVMIERTMPPDILVHGLVTPEDVEELFKIFYERINVFLSILDPAIHTPARTFARCPFLFTVVCAISSRYYLPKESIYKYAMHFAKSAAASSLIDGWKSVELCQAYLLMSVYAVPARRWEEDRSWLYLGLAIRIATDLNLHQPSSAAVTAVANTSANSGNSNNLNGSPNANGSGVRGRLHNHNHYPSHSGSTASTRTTMSSSSPSPSASMTSPGGPASPTNTSIAGASSKSSEKQEKHERELLNRTRTWLICFNLDRSISTQLGKPSTIKEDFIIRNASEWYKRSPFNMPYDVHLCAYTELLRIVTRFHDDVWSGSRPVANAGGIKGTDVDFYTITMRYDDQLRLFQEQAAARFERDSKKDDPGSVYRTGLLPFMVNYSRLVMFSFGFQQAVERGLQRDDIFFQRCFEAACAVITTVVDRLAPTGYFRFAPDGHFVFVSFAAAFLLKLLRPDFSRIVNRTHKEQVLTLVRKLIRMLGSQEIAVDDKHTPKLYSRFLAGLVSRHSTSRKNGFSASKNSGAVGGNENGTTSQMSMHGQMMQQRGTTTTAVQSHHPPTTGHGPGNFDMYGNPVSSAPQIMSQQSQSHSTLDSQAYESGQYSSMYDQQQQQAAQQSSGHSHPISTGYYSPPGNVPGSAAHEHQYVSGMNAGNSGIGMETAMQSPQSAGHIQGHNHNAVEQYDDELGGAFQVPMSADEYLASMQAINNPGWWESVMMPGFNLPGPHHFTNVQQQQQQFQTQYNQMEVESAQGHHGHGHSHSHSQSHSRPQQPQYMASQDRNNMQTYPDSGEYPFRFEN